MSEYGIDYLIADAEAIMDRIGPVPLTAEPQQLEALHRIHDALVMQDCQDTEVLARIAAYLVPDLGARSQPRP